MLGSRHHSNGNRRFVATRLATLIASFVLSLAFSSPAAAQLIECHGLSTTGGYKVLLDELSYAKAALGSDSELRAFMDRLRFVFASKMESLRAETEQDATTGQALKVIQCNGRRPIDGSEFTRSMVDALNTWDAILEVWGMLDATDVPGSPRRREARVGYLLIPIRFYESGSPDLTGIYFARYAKDTAARPGDLPEMFEKMFEQAKELKAYAAVGTGVKLLRSRRYDLARQYLCKAEHLLNEAWPEPVRLGIEARSLLNYVRASARQTMTAARQDPAYKGSLRLLSDAAACPGGR